MNITQAAIDNTRVTFVALFCVLLAGFLYFAGAPKAEDPGFTIRTAQVVTRFPGGSPERVEQLVTDKLEKAIQEMPELKDLKSSSKAGLSVINVNIRDEFRGAQVRAIWDSLRRKVDGSRDLLPEGVIGPEVNDEFGDVFGIVVSLTGDGYDYAELKDIADDVRDELLTLKDTAKVDIYGAQAERIFIEFKLEKLSEIGLSPGKLRQILSQQNIVAPGGSIVRKVERFAFEPTGNFESVEDIRDTLIRIPETNQSVRLGDIADVVRGYVDPATSRFHATGEPGLALAVSMRQGGNILALGEQVHAMIDDLQGEYPYGVNFEFVVTQPRDVQNTINGFTSSLIQAVVIVLLSMLVFLGLRTGLVVASLIPTAMAATFVAMALLKMGLDKVTLAALVIALGLLVDNAVVMAESALVYMQQGKTAVKAAVMSASELKIPLLISSLTTIAAFMPLALAENTMGEFLGPLAIVLAITLLMSWLLAITMVPMLCAMFLRTNPKDVKSDEETYGTRFYRTYRKLLLTLLTHRLVAILGVVAIFVGALSLFGKVPKIFMSESNLPSFTVELKGPRGMDIDATTVTTREIEQWMKDQLLVNDEREHGLVNWATYIGNGGPRFYLGHTPEDPSPEYALIVANADSGETVPKLVARIRDYVDANYPDIEAIAKARQSGGNAKNPIGIEITGKEVNQVFDIVQSLQAQLVKIPGVVNVRDDWGQRTKKIVVQIDDARLKRAGLTNNDVAVSLQSAFDGFQVTQYREGDELIPTVMRAHLPWRGQQRRPIAINAFSEATTTSVPMGQVASISMVWEPPLIRRKDRAKTVEVQANLEAGYTAAEVNAQIEPWLEQAQKAWPRGYRHKITGEAEKSKEANAAIGAKLPIAGLIIVLLLVLQFNSIRRSAIVLLTIPLSIIGVIVGLLLCHSYFGFMALLGVLSLAGIVINNAIVLLDRISIEIQEGKSPAFAVIASAQKRLRPILLTTATTILGLIPLWFGDDPMWVPMAISIIFGLAFATLLTLGVVPVLYALFFRVPFKGFDYDKELAAST